MKIKSHFAHYHLMRQIKKPIFVSSFTQYKSLPQSYILIDCRNKFHIVFIIWFLPFRVSIVLMPNYVNSLCTQVKGIETSAKVCFCCTTWTKLELSYFSLLRHVNSLTSSSYPFYPCQLQWL